MISKTLKQKANNLLNLDDEFLQYCELNKIDDIEKLAKETFKMGFDLLKYGNTPIGVLTVPDNPKYIVKDNPIIKEAKSEAIVLPHSNSMLPNEEIKKEIKERIQKLEKKDLYDE